MGEIYRDRVVGGELRIGSRESLSHLRLRGPEASQSVANNLDLSDSSNMETLIKTLKYNGSIAYQGVGISGTVVDSVTGLPIEGATVHFIGADDADGNAITIVSVETDENGEYESPSIPGYDLDFDSPEITLYITADGYDYATVIVDGADAEDGATTVITPDTQLTSSSASEEESTGS